MRRAAAVCGLAAGLTGIGGIALLALFYAIQVPHLHAAGGRWGSDPGASLGYANDVSGIVFEVLLLPFAILLWRLLADRGRPGAVAVVVMGTGSAAVAALAGLGMVTNVLAVPVASAVSGVCSILLAVWAGVYSARGSARAVLPRRALTLGKAIGIAIPAAAVLAGAAFLLPHSPLRVGLIVAFALPGVLAYIALPCWIGWGALVVLAGRLRPGRSAP